MCQCTHPLSLLDLSKTHVITQVSITSYSNLYLMALLAFSGYLLPLPSEESPMRNLAINLWTPPEDCMLLATVDHIPHSTPQSGSYGEFLSKLNSSKGVKSADFWSAFTLCPLCDHIMIGEYEAGHESECIF